MEVLEYELVGCAPADAFSVRPGRPVMLERGSDIFERFVLTPCREVRALLADCGVDLIVHNCGELLTEMVASLGCHFAGIAFFCWSCRHFSPVYWRGTAYSLL